MCSNLESKLVVLYAVCLHYWNSGASVILVQVVYFVNGIHVFEISTDQMGGLVIGLFFFFAVLNRLGKNCRHDSRWQCQETPSIRWTQHLQVSLFFFFLISMIIRECIVKVNNHSLTRSLWVAFESITVLTWNLQGTPLLKPAGTPVLPLIFSKIVSFWIHKAKRHIAISFDSDSICLCLCSNLASVLLVQFTLSLG